MIWYAHWIADGVCIAIHDPDGNPGARMRLRQRLFPPLERAARWRLRWCADGIGFPIHIRRVDS